MPPDATSLLPVLESDAPTAQSDDPYDIVGWNSRAPSGSWTLSRNALKRARDVSEALFTTDDGPPPRARMDWMEKDLKDFFGNANWRGAAIFQACIFAITWLAPLLLFRLPPIGRLTVAHRVEAIERFENLPVMVLTVLGAKAILSLIYYEHPDSADEIGWDQECISGEAPK